MHGQPGHATQICCGTLPNVVVVSTKVLVRELCHKHKEKKIQILFPSSRQYTGCILSLLTASPSLHFQLPLSEGFLRFSPIQNQCCSWSSDSLWVTLSSSLSPSWSHYTECHTARRSHSPKGLVEHLQHKVLLLRAGDAQQVGAASLTEQVSLQPAQLLLQLGGMKHLQAGDTGVKKKTS